MSYAVPLNDIQRVQMHYIFVQIVEQSNAFTEYHRHEVDVEFINQARTQILLRDIRTTTDVNCFLISG